MTDGVEINAYRANDPSVCAPECRRRLAAEDDAMGMDWEGPIKCGWGYNGFRNLEWYLVLGALRSKRDVVPADDVENIEDLADFSDLQKDMLLQNLAENDPVRKFLLQPARGKLSPQESAALAARLAEIIYFLTKKRMEQGNFIFLPHMAKRRQFQDSQVNQIALLMWDCATAAERGVDITWDSNT